MPKKILFIGLLIIVFLLSCSHKSSPTEPQETADLSVNMLLKPAKENGYNVTRVHVRISRSTFVDSMDLTINGESASGTFTDLKVGTYQIEVWVYEDTTLIATGSGTGEVKAGQTVNVTITVTFLTGNLGVTVNWGSTSVEPNTILFEMETGATVDIQGVSSVVNGTVNGDYIEWEENYSIYNADPTNEKKYFPVPNDVIIKFRLSSSGKFSSKLYSSNDSFNHIFLVLCAKTVKPKENRKPTDRWIPGWNSLDYLEGNVPADFNNLLEYFIWNMSVSTVMGMEFGYLKESGFVQNGPDHIYKFLQKISKNFSLKAGFEKPLFLLFSQICHQQADYSWHPQKVKEFDKYKNSHFSPAPKDVWDINFTAKRNFKVSLINPITSTIHLTAYNDNSNHSYIELDGDKIVEQINWGVDQTALYDTNLNNVTIFGQTVWSILSPSIFIIMMGDGLEVKDWHEERDGIVDPADSWDQNPKPLVLKIDKSGTSIVK